MRKKLSSKVIEKLLAEIIIGETDIIFPPDAKCKYCDHPLDINSLSHKRGAMGYDPQKGLFAVCVCPNCNKRSIIKVKLAEECYNYVKGESKILH